MIFGRIASIGLDQRNFGKHSLHRTKAAQIYRRTGNLHAVQLLLGQILALRRLMISEDAEVRRGPRSTAGSADTGYFSSQMSSSALTVEDAVDHKGQPVYPRAPAGPIGDGDHAGTPLVLARTAPKEAGSTSDN